LTFQAVLIAGNVCVTLAFLIYASWLDHKTREVSNRVWAVYGPIAIVLSLAGLLLYQPSKLPLFGISIGFTVGLAFLLFYSGGFGGADSKALMCIAFALPFAPVAVLLPIFGQSPISQLIFPLTIFSNGVLFAAATGLYVLIRNLVWHRKTGRRMFVGTLADESFWKKILVLITGYKMSIAKLKEKWHIFPLEDLQENDEAAVKRELVVVPHEEGRDKIVERLSNAAAAGKIDAYVWASPGLPMLIFITLGLIVALVFGDLVWLLVRFVLI
jgi:preflagellin peptidase FlaK